MQQGTKFACLHDVKNELLPGHTGAGPLLQRDYWAVFAGCALKPSEIMTHVATHFGERPPASLVRVVAPTGAAAVGRTFLTRSASKPRKSRSCRRTISPSDAESDDRFLRARVALTNYHFSDPRIVRTHFDPAEPLLRRCMLLEIQVLGLHYLCPAIVTRVREEPGVFGFRYETLEGHIARGVEWFLLTKRRE